MTIPMYEQIYLSILGKIQNGDYNGGDQLPSEKELAEEFNVSRITSKKALDILAQKKVVERIRGRGSFVSKDFRDTGEIFKTESLSTVKEEHLIGLIIPDFSDSHGLRLLKAIEEKCSELNCVLLVKRTFERIEEEEKAIDSFIKMGVKGLLVYPIHGRHYNNHILKLVLDHFPLVLIDRYFRGVQASSICTDNKLATQAITNHLISLGHQHIGFVSLAPEGTTAVEERIQGFHIAYSQHGLKLDPEYFITIDSLVNENMEGNTEIIKNVIEKKPEITAFFTSSYGVAVILTNALSRLGKKVPEDYSIVTFDHPTTILDKPTFTHIEQKEANIGEKAMEMVFTQINGDNELKHLFVDFNLIEGKSTKPL